MLDDNQKSAVDFAVNNRLAIINGGAGTGKTTIIKAIAERIGNSCELCAFAGKAAARLREATGKDASTIHSLLNYQGESQGFTRETLQGSAVIIDEASMVSSDLLAEIVKRSPDKLILVGDEAQLPPVGSGQPFHDIINKRGDLVRTLTKCYRNQEAVYRAATEVREGRVPERTYQSANENFEHVVVGNEDRAHLGVLDFVRNGDIDFQKDIVLCCRNGEGTDTPCSVGSLNADIKSILNPAVNGDNRSPLRQLDPEDRVIRVKNDPKTDTWNGTTGTVVAYDQSGAMWVKLDYPVKDYDGNYTSEVLIDRKKISDWQLGYALTVHKAQGSQYRKVYFTSLVRDTALLLDRSMLYTAITRAKNECYLLGEQKAIQLAVKSNTRKTTVLQTLLEA